MSLVKIEGNASGTGVFTVASPNSNTDRTLTLPDNTGTVALTSDLPYALTSGTSVASTSGTSVDFTSIPSWVKRITVMLSGVSTNGSSQKLFQIGSGSIDISGYLSVASYNASGSVGTSTSTAGFIAYSAVGTADTMSGSIVLTLLSSNNWVCSYTIANYGSALVMLGGGNKTLSGTLDRVRITTVNGTDTFDAGSINILYE